MTFPYSANRDSPSLPLFVRMDTIKLARFTLLLSCAVVMKRTSDEDAEQDPQLPVPIEEEVVLEAMQYYKGRDLWFDYLSSLMQDTLEDANLEEELYDDESMNPRGIKLTFLRDTEDKAKFQLAVSWRGADCLPLDVMEEAAMWRIEDRLTMYGTEDFDFMICNTVEHLEKKRVSIVKKE